MKGIICSGLAGIVISGSILLGGCGESVQALPRQFEGSYYRAPTYTGPTSLISLGIQGGLTQTRSVTNNGRWIGVRTQDFHWNFTNFKEPGQKIGEVYFEFPPNSTEVGFVRKKDEWDRERASITYKIPEGRYSETWGISIMPYNVKFVKMFIQDSRMTWVKDPSSPRVKAFYVKPGDNFVPVDASKRGW